MLKVYCPLIKNLGDFFNTMPVLSGLSKHSDQHIKLVVNDEMRQFKGFRDFMEFQHCIGNLYFRQEIFGMEESEYIILHYSQEEFKNVEQRPNRPLETQRVEKFLKDNYPMLLWEVDDNFTLAYDDINTGLILNRDMVVCGDRWLKGTTDNRRSSHILHDSKLFENDKFYFLDYENYCLMDNVAIIANSTKPFFGTFTGSSVIADLLNKKHYVLYNNDMVNPPWNGCSILYSYWKHYYGTRYSQLFHVDDVNLKGVLESV